MKGPEFGSLYERYASDVLRFALYLTGSRADAEEIVAETFVRAWVATGDIRVETVKAYLLSIARNLHLAGHRARAREASMPGEVRDGRPGPEAATVARDELRAVMRVLNELPEIDRAAVLMRSESLAYDEIARALDISPAAARVKVHRARLKLAGLGLGRSGP